MHRIERFEERAQAHLQAGRFAVAATILSKAVLCAQSQKLGAQVLAGLLTRLGIANKYKGCYAEARRSYRRASALLQRQGQAKSALAADLLHNHGGLCHVQGRYAEAERWARQGLVLRRKLVDSYNDPGLLADEVALAAILHERGKLRSAARLYERALASYDSPALRRSLGHERMVAWNNLAATRAALGEAQTAKELYTKSLALKRRLLGRAHPDLATTLNNLAMLHDGLGEFRQARARLRLALKILEATLGRSHPHHAVLQSNYDKIGLPSAKTANVRSN